MSSSVIPEPKGAPASHHLHQPDGSPTTTTTTDNNQNQQQQQMMAMNRGDQASAIAASLTKPLKVNYRMILPFCPPPSTARNAPGELGATVNEINQQYSVDTPSLLDIQEFATPKPDDGSYRGYLPFPDNPRAKEVQDMNFKMHQRELDLQTRQHSELRRDSSSMVMMSSSLNDQQQQQSKQLQEAQEDQDVFGASRKTSIIENAGDDSQQLEESMIAGGAPDIADLVVRQTQRNHDNPNTNSKPPVVHHSNNHNNSNNDNNNNNNSSSNSSNNVSMFLTPDEFYRNGITITSSLDNILRLRPTSVYKEQLETGDDDGKHSSFLWSQSFGIPYRPQEELDKLPAELANQKVRHRFKPSFYGPYFETLHLSNFNRYSKPDATTTFAAYCEAERLRAEGTRDWFADWRSLVLAGNSSSSAGNKCWNLSLSMMGARFLEIERFVEEFSEATKATATKIADQLHAPTTTTTTTASSSQQQQQSRQNWVLHPIGDGFDDVFVVDGIVYVVATSPSFASFYGSGHGAWKACHNELLAVRSLLGMMLMKNIVPPLVSLVERGGVCVFASAPMPIVRRELVCGEYGSSHSSVYAAEESGLFSSYEIAEFFALQLHTIRNNSISGESTNIPTPADLKFFRSRKYDCDILIDCARLWPTSVVPAQYARPSGSAATLGGGGAGSEQQQTTSTTTTATTTSSKTAKTLMKAASSAAMIAASMPSSSSSASSNNKVALCRHEIDDLPGAHLYSLLRPEFMRSYCPSVLNPDIGLSHQNFNNFDQIGYAVATTIFKVRLPACQNELISRAANDTLSGDQLSDILHSHGINFRYLGKIALELELISFRTTPEAALARKAFEICAHEIACRSFVRLLRNELRTKVGEFAQELYRQQQENPKTKQHHQDFNSSQAAKVLGSGRNSSNNNSTRKHDTGFHDESSIIVQHVKQFLRCAGAASEHYWLTFLRTQMEDQFGCFFMPLKEVSAEDVANGLVPTNLGGTGSSSSSTSTATTRDGSNAVYVSLNTGKSRAVVTSSQSQWKESSAVPGTRTLIVTNEAKDEADMLRRSAVVALLGPGAFLNIHALLRVMKLAGFTITSDVRGRRLTATCNAKVKPAKPMFVSNTLATLVEWCRTNPNSDYLQWKEREIIRIKEIHQHNMKTGKATMAEIQTMNKGNNNNNNNGNSIRIPSASTSPSPLIYELSLVVRDRLGLCDVVENAAKTEMARYAEHDMRNCSPLWLLALAQFGKQSPGGAYVSASRWGSLRGNCPIPIAQCVSQLYCSQLMEEMQRFERSESLGFEGLVKLSKLLPREDPDTMAWAIQMVGLQLYRSVMKAATSTIETAPISHSRRIQRSLDYLEHAIKWFDPLFSGLQFHRNVYATICLLRYHILMRATCCKCSTSKEKTPATLIRVDASAVSESKANEYLENIGVRGGGGGGGHYSPGGGSGGAAGGGLGGGTQHSHHHHNQQRASPHRARFTSPTSNKTTTTTTKRGGAATSTHRLGEEALRQMNNNTNNMTNPNFAHPNQVASFGLGGDAGGGGQDGNNNNRAPRRGSIFGSMSSHVATTSVAEEEEDLFARVSLPSAHSIFNGIDSDTNAFVPRALSCNTIYKTMNTYNIKKHPLSNPSSNLMKGCHSGVTLLVPTRYYCDQCAKKQRAVKPEYHFEPILHEVSVMMSRCVAAFDSSHNLIQKRSPYDHYGSSNDHNQNNTQRKSIVFTTTNKKHHHDPVASNPNHTPETRLLRVLGDARLGLVLRHAGCTTGTTSMIGAAVEELARVWGTDSYLCCEARTVLAEVLLERSEIIVPYTNAKSRDLPMVINADDTLRQVYQTILLKVEHVIDEADKALDAVTTIASTTNANDAAAPQHHQNEDQQQNHHNNNNNNNIMMANSRPVMTTYPPSSSDLANMAPSDDSARIPHTFDLQYNELIPRVAKRLQFILTQIYNNMPTAKRELDLVHFLLDSSVRHLGKSHRVSIVCIETLICFYLNYLEDRANAGHSSSSGAKKSSSTSQQHHQQDDGTSNVLNLAGTLKMIGQYLNMWLSGSIQTSNAKLASSYHSNSAVAEEEKALGVVIDGLITVMREGVLRRLRRANTLSDRATMIALTDEMRNILSRAPVHVLSMPHIVGNMSILDDFVAGATGQQQQQQQHQLTNKNNNKNFGGDNTFLTSGGGGSRTVGGGNNNRGLTSATMMTNTSANTNNNNNNNNEDDVGANATRAAMEEIHRRKESIMDNYRKLIRHADRTDLFANSVVRRMDDEVRKLRRLGALWHKKDTNVAKAAMALYPLVDELLKRKKKPDAYYKTHSAGLHELDPSEQQKLPGDHNHPTLSKEAGGGGGDGIMNNNNNNNNNNSGNQPYHSPYEGLESNREQPVHVQETMIAQTLRALKQPVLHEKPKQVYLPPMPRSETIFEHLLTSSSSASDNNNNQMSSSSQSMMMGNGGIRDSSITKIKKLFPKVVASGASLNFSAHAATANNVVTSTQKKRMEKKRG